MDEVIKKKSDNIKVVKGIRYFPAKSGVMMRDQIIKMLCESDIPYNVYGYERLLKCISNGLRTYKRKYKTRLDEQTLHVSAWFKSALAVQQNKAVGLIFAERDELFIWVAPTHRRQGIATELVKTLKDKYPVEFENHLLRPWLLKDYKRINNDTKSEAEFWKVIHEDMIL